MNDSIDIIIQQTLHGYNEGHKLLASSVNLDITEKRILQSLSDYSGSGIEKGFKEYITGYPIPKSNYYVISKTWYAPEMSRPGCVWTHSLLIDFTIFSTVFNSQVLLKLFKRPEIKDYNFYTQEILLPTQRKINRKNHFEDSFYELSCLVYNQTDKGIIILAEDSETYQSDILGIWDLQWPRLKRSFTFCTGSLSPRVLEKKYFDLQIMPSQRERTLSKFEREQFYIINLQNSKCDDKWKDEYKEFNSEELLQFMTDLGSDINGTRFNYSVLLKAFRFSNLFKELEDIQIIEFLISSFPDPSQGKFLKVKLLDLALQRKKIDNYTLLTTILENPSLKLVDWNYNELIIDAWNKKKITQSELNKILKLASSQLKESEFVELLSNLSIESWLGILNINTELIVSLLKTTNKFEKSSLIWETNLSQQDLWFNCFKKKGITKWKDVVFSMLEVENEHFVEKLYGNLGTDLLDIVINWISVREKPLSRGWQNLLREEGEKSFQIFATKTKLSNSALDLFLNIYTPNSTFWKNIEFNIVCDLVENLNQSSYNLGKAGVYTLLLSCSFNNHINCAKEVTKLVFQKLHDILGDDFCHMQTWHRFNSIVHNDIYSLVELDFFSTLFVGRYEIPDWDRCEFLRLSLVTYFIKYNWEPLFLIDVIENKKTFALTVKLGSKIKPVKRLFKELKKALENNSKTSIPYYKVICDFV